MAILREEQWRKCSECGTRKALVHDASYGCDGCGKPIDALLEQSNIRRREYLELSVHNWESSSRLQFCSWKCVIRGLRKVESDYFVVLPYLHYDDAAKGQRVSDFLALFGKRWAASRRS